MQCSDTHWNPKFPVGLSMCLTTIFSINFFQEVKDQLDSPDFVNTFWLCLWCTKGVLIYHTEKWRLCKGGCEETVPTLVSIMYLFVGRAAMCGESCGIFTRPQKSTWNTLKGADICSRTIRKEQRKRYSLSTVPVPGNYDYNCSFPVLPPSHRPGINDLGLYATVHENCVWFCFFFFSFISPPPPPLFSC